MKMLANLVNPGVEFYNYVSVNVQSLLMAGIVCIGLWFFLQRKMSNLVTVAIVTVIAVVFVFAPSVIKGLGIDIFNQFFI